MPIPSQPQDNGESSLAGKALHCRCNARCWWHVVLHAGVIWLAFAILDYYPQLFGPPAKVKPGSMFLLLGSFVLFSLLAGLWSLLNLLCLRVLADDGGLRWRRIWLWRRASWDEVREYYLINTGTTRIIVTDAEKLSFDSDLLHCRELARLVQARALGNSHATLPQ